MMWLKKGAASRTGALAIVLLLGAAICAYAGGNKESGSSSSTTNTGSSSFVYTGSGPVTDNPSAEISILATNAYTSNVDLAKAQVVNEIAKKAGVKVDWELISPSTYQDAIAPRLASGSNLPDIVYLIPPDPTGKYIRSGIFQPLDTLYQQYGVNLKKLYADPMYAPVKAMLTAPDGKVYYVPQLTETTQYVAGFMLNMRWLAALNLQVPQTLDQFTAMLRAFKKYDPNKDGGKNIVPFSIDKAFIEQAFGPAFGISFPFYADKNGKVQFAYYTPAYKEFLTYLHGLYAEGLIDSDFANTKRDQITARFAKNTTGGTFDFSYVSSMVYSTQFPDYSKDQPLIMPVPPFKGPHGDQFYVTRVPITGVFGITKGSKNAAVAFKFLDYAIGPESQNTYTWGDEGVTYEVVNGKRQWTQQGKDNTFIQQYGINPVNMPINQSAAGVDQIVPKWHLDADRKVEPFVQPPFPFVYSQPDEASLEDQIMPDVNTYVNEQEINFITGKTSLDQFDKFESTLKSMNIEAVIKAKQAQYDRFAAAMKK